MNSSALTWLVRSIYNRCIVQQVGGAVRPHEFIWHHEERVDGMYIMYVTVQRSFSFEDCGRCGSRLLETCLTQCVHTGGAFVTMTVDKGTASRALARLTVILLWKNVSEPVNDWFDFLFV